MGLSLGRWDVLPSQRPGSTPVSSWANFFTSLSLHLLIEDMVVHMPIL